jgi:hypothetical protein
MVSVADVTANLKGKVTKLNVQKILGILAGNSIVVVTQSHTERR